MWDGGGEDGRMEKVEREEDVEGDTLFYFIAQPRLSQNLMFQ